MRPFCKTGEYEESVLAVLQISTMGRMYTSRMSPFPVALVTGAARRVGAAIACALHAAGAGLVLHYRDSAAEAETLATRLNALRPDSAITVGLPLDDETALPVLCHEALAHFGRLDVLVNNASSFFRTPVGQIDRQAWEDISGSNLRTPLFLSQLAAPHLKRTRGCIVNITDIHAERPLKDYAVYCSAKSGLLGLTRALAIDLAPEVRVNAVAPGAIIWPTQDEAFSPGEREAIIEHTLLKRTGTPEDIARTVRFLAFDAPYITGQVINVDGGRTAHL